MNPDNCGRLVVLNRHDPDIVAARYHSEAASLVANPNRRRLLTASPDRAIFGLGAGSRCYSGQSGSTSTRSKNGLPKSSFRSIRN